MTANNGGKRSNRNGGWLKDIMLCLTIVIFLIVYEYYILQAIHDFVTAVPNEQELSMLFGLDHQAERNNNRNIHDITEEGIGE